MADHDDLPYRKARHPLMDILSDNPFVYLMYSVASKNIHGLAYFLFRGRYFSAYSFCFLHNLCTIVGRKVIECGQKRGIFNATF